MTMTVWQADDSGVQPCGDVGGDYQATDSYGRRFTRPDVPNAMINVTYYGVACRKPGSEEPNGEYAVEEQVETLVCRDPADPGGTEVWSDTTYRDVNYRVITSQAEADRKARAYAERADMYGCDWDGRPVY